ncbi:Mov34/MPN/PAD-1 family protein [Herpetosiphon geysericola]|uniref:JAB domain-containing protein n=1 Tax=Herpetosiphon geysericola TaxID=70996 RepID=A0A0P6YDB2_9CHLR|nr:Mov34/MPN/PAD-1 family protein [Herpetosiphon geysericola]KPL89973.1 hypothetical protein SE18_08415 [Herpetosiphon geysericola]
MQTLANLVRHYIAAADQPLPPPTPGIDWLFAANGLFKRATNAALSATICVEQYNTSIYGLNALLPSVQWNHHRGLLPASWLDALLNSACDACTLPSGMLRPLEKQWFVIWRNNGVRLIAPTEQHASAGSVRYAMPQEPVLLDIHSHHTMRAYFSGTDDRDDQGLSISMVVGNIFEKPEAVARLNVYGHRQRIPLTMLFDGLGPFTEGGSYAAAKF